MLTPPMLMQTVHLPHTHTGNALVSCVCDAVAHLLLSVEQSCEWSGVFTSYWFDQQRELPVNSGNLCPRIKPFSCMYSSRFHTYLSPFYVLSLLCRALQSVIVKSNAVHQTLMAN